MQPIQSGGNASHLMFVGVWNLVPGLTTVFKRTDTEANKILRYANVDYNLGTATRLTAKDLPGMFLPDICLICLMMQLIRDTRLHSGMFIILLLVLNTAFAGGIAPPSGFANMRILLSIFHKRQLLRITDCHGQQTGIVLFSRTDVGDSSGVIPLSGCSRNYFLQLPQEHQEMRTSRATGCISS